MIECDCSQAGGAQQASEGLKQAPVLRIRQQVRRNRTAMDQNHGRRSLALLSRMVDVEQQRAIRGRFVR